MPGCRRPTTGERRKAPTPNPSPEDGGGKSAVGDSSSEDAGVGIGVADGTTITRRPAWAFAADSAREALAKQFGTRTLEGFGFDLTDGGRDMPAIRAAGAILDYLTETQKASLAHLDRLTPHRLGATLEIDPSTRRSLELTRTLRDGRREGSLLGSSTEPSPPWARGCWPIGSPRPTTDRAAIDARLDAVGELLHDTAMADGLRSKLRTVFDIERLLARVDHRPSNAA